MVIGFGIAGGSAAVSAAAAGARVLVLEKAAAAGGTSAMAGGHFYLGGGTAVQQATGHDDSADEMYKYLVAVSRGARPRQDPRLLRRQRRALQLAWRTWVFSSSAASTRARSSSRPAPRGCPTPATRRCGRSCEQAKPAPRGHSVPVPGELGGAAMVIDLLVKRADELGVADPLRDRGDRTSSSTTVRWSVCAGSTSRETGAIKAKSVIIAAGGFAMNPEMVAEHTPALGQKRRTKHHGVVEPYILGNPNDDGLGIRLGVSAGGVAENLDQLFITAAAYPPEILLTGHHRQQGRQAVRRRGLLPLAHLGLRARATRPDRRISSSTRHTCRCPRCR